MVIDDLFCAVILGDFSAARSHQESLYCRIRASGHSTLERERPGTASLCRSVDAELGPSNQTRLLWFVRDFGFKWRFLLTLVSCGDLGRVR